MPTKTRVLIVEHEADWRNDHILRIKKLGYEPIVAEGYGDDLIEDATRKCKVNRCHIVIADFRLRNNANVSDNSGITEIVKALPIPYHIIVSAYISIDQADEFFNDRVRFVGKLNVSKRLTPLIKELANKNSAFARNLKLESLSYLENVLNRFCKHMSIQKEEIEDILTQMNSSANICKLLPIDGTPATPSVTLNRNSFVCRIQTQEDKNAEFIIKIARIEKIEREYENYKNFIKGQLINKRSYVSIDEESGVVISYQIGGIQFDKVENAKTFSYVYCQSDIPDENWKSRIKTAIDSYAKNWSYYTKPNSNPLYRPERVYKQTLLDIYCSVWDQGKTTSKFMDRLETSCRNISNQLDHPVYKTQLNGILVNPLKWVLDSKIYSDRGDGFLYTQITHGDLWGENLFVADEGNTSIIIDYERTGRGYELQDFVQLEFDVITRLITLEHKDINDWNLLHHFYIAVISNNELAEEVRFLTSNNEINKAIYAVNTIRTAARDCAYEKRNSRLYLHAMLLNCVFRATINIPDINDIASSDQTKTEAYLQNWKNERERAILLGGLIIHKLTTKKAWPPSNWPKFQSLSIHEALSLGGLLSQADIEMVQSICFQVDFDYDNLLGTTPAAKLRDLYYKAKTQFKHLNLTKLTKALKEVYPSYDWVD